MKSNKEEVKLKIMNQFKDTNSDIHYLMSSNRELDSVQASVLYALSEFEMNMRVIKPEGSDCCLVSFDEFDGYDYLLLNNVHDLSNQSDKNALIHYVETLIVSENGIKFRLSKYELIHNDYEFKFVLKTPSDWESFEFDLLNETVTSGRFDEVDELLGECASRARGYNGPYHSLKFDKKILKQIKATNWFKQLDREYQQKLMRLFCCARSEYKWYFQYILRELDIFFPIVPYRIRKGKAGFPSISV